MTEKLHMGDLVSWVDVEENPDWHKKTFGVIIQVMVNGSVFSVQWNNGEKLYAARDQLTLRARAKR